MPSKLAAVTSDPMLINYAQGAAQRNVMPVADFLAPPVDVATMIGRYKKYDQKHRFKAPDTRRSLGGNATRIFFDATDGTFNCTPHAIDVPIDKLETKEAEYTLPLLSDAADLAAAVAGLSHEKDTIDKALAAAGAGTDSNFTSDAVDPVDLLDQAILDVIVATGYGSLMGVGILFGATAWKRTKNNARVRSRYVVAAGATKGSVGQVTPSYSDFGKLLLAEPPCEVSFMVCDEEPEGQDAAYTLLMDDAILVFARMAEPNRYDPSFMKTFRLAGEWMKPGFYESEDGRLDIPKFDWSEDVQVTNPTAVKRLNAKAS